MLLVFLPLGGGFTVAEKVKLPWSSRVIGSHGTKVVYVNIFLSIILSPLHTWLNTCGVNFIANLIYEVSM